MLEIKNIRVPISNCLEEGGMPAKYFFNTLNAAFVQ